MSDELVWALIPDGARGIGDADVLLPSGAAPAGNPNDGEGAAVVCCDRLEAAALIGDELPE